MDSVLALARTVLAECLVLRFCWHSYLVSVRREAWRVWEDAHSSDRAAGGAIYGACCATIEEHTKLVLNWSFHLSINYRHTGPIHCERMFSYKKCH